MAAMGAYGRAMAGISHALSAVAAFVLVAASSPSASAAIPGWAWPVRGEVLTEYRNGGDPYASGQHRGIDIAASIGEPVIAATGGTVRFAGVAGSSGLTVSVRSSDGRFDISYLHLAETEVRDGERVVGGQRVGAVGTSGTRSAGAPHLHFGVREAGSRHAYRDPRALLPVLPPAPRVGPAPAPRPVEEPVVPMRRPVASVSRPLPAPSPAWVAVGLPAALALAGLALWPRRRLARSRRRVTSGRLALLVRR